MKESNIFKRKSILLTTFTVILLIIFRENSVQGQNDIDNFEISLQNAISRQDKHSTDSILSNNRLLAKPYVNALITKYISLELKGNFEESQSTLSLAEIIADRFQALFEEKSLSTGVKFMLNLNKAQKRSKLEADSLYDLGTKFRLANDNEKSLSYFKETLEIYREIGDERGESEVLGGLGALYFNNFKDYETAFKFYNDALIKRQNVDDRQLIGNTLNSLGAVYQAYFKDFDKAIYYYDQAIEIRKEIGDLKGMRTVLLNKSSGLSDLSRQLSSKGRFIEAIDSLNKSYEICSNIDAGYVTGEVLNQMGLIYSRMGDYETAIDKLKQAEKIMKEENDSISLAGVYNHFGIVFQNAGKLEKSKEYLNMGLKIYEIKSDFEDQVPVLDNLGIVYFDLNEYQEAEKYYLKGLELCKKFNFRNSEIDFLVNLANSQLLQKKYNDSKLNYDKALDLAKAINNPDLIWRITVGLATYNEKTGNFQRSIELNNFALALMESIRRNIKNEDLKATFLAKERYIFEDIINLLEDRNQTVNNYDTLAFSYAEHCKSRVLLDYLSKPGKEERIEGSFDSIDVLNSFQVPELLSLEESIRMCQKKSIQILDYIVSDSSSYLWVITKSGSKSIRLPGAKKIGEQIEIIRTALVRPQQNADEFFINASKTLYDLLLKPAETHLSATDQMVIMPDGILNYLPFEVLLTDDNLKGTGSFSALPFLVKKFAISYVQSASVLKILISGDSLQSKNTKRRRLIAFGDPVYDNTDSVSLWEGRLNRLQYSSREINKISSYFKPEYRKIFLRDQATEDNLKNTLRTWKSDYLHFAAHSYPDEKDPKLNSIILTKTPFSGEDGFFQVAEINSTSINAKMVVLSACQTGLGKLIKGEGLVGLTQAFLSAGAQSVLVSQWNVDDESTSILMGEFYRNLIKKGESKTESLRNARLYLIKFGRYSHPFYWAPFVLVGEWQ